MAARRKLLIYGGSYNKRAERPRGTGVVTAQRRGPRLSADVRGAAAVVAVTGSLKAGRRIMHAWSIVPVSGRCWTTVLEDRRVLPRRDAGRRVAVSSGLTTDRPSHLSVNNTLPRYPCISTLQHMAASLVRFYSQL